MDHNNYKEKLQMYFFDELSSKEKVEMEYHIKNCNECSNELKELHQLRSFLSLKKQNVSDTLLDEARSELKTRIRIEKNKKSLRSRFIEFKGNINFLQPAYVFSSIAFVAAGVFAGYLLFKSPAEIIAPDINLSAVEENIKINNVKFIDSDASDGEVEFIFDAVKQVHVKGNIKDEEVRSVLMFAMLNEDNPGVRLNTLNFINEIKSGQIDPEVKAAVMAVVKYDNNPGVRREAFALLKKLPFDDEIKNTYLHVLMNDSVSGLRIEAINGLFNAAQNGELFTQDELSVFKQKMHGDDNSYIRLRAQTVLKEYN
jgi:hypothetical protein